MLRIEPMPLELQCDALAATKAPNPRDPAIRRTTAE
jgi:hypothetical protein